MSPSEQGVFDAEVSLFTVFRAELQFRGKIMGGVPKDPEIIEAWLRSKAGVTDEEELLHMLRKTVRELGAELTPDATMEEIIEASQQIAGERQTNGFKRDDNGLFIEGRKPKAMLKECTNALYGKRERWGPTGKGPKSFLAEHVFIEPDRIYLGVDEPTGVDLIIGHVQGRSTLTYVEYVLRPRIEFFVYLDELAVDVLLDQKDEVGDRRLPKIFVHAQQNGLGALRSQSHGKFTLVAWEQVDRTHLPNMEKKPGPIEEDGFANLDSDEVQHRLASGMTMEEIFAEMVGHRVPEKEVAQQARQILASRLTYLEKTRDLDPVPTLPYTKDLIAYVEAHAA